MYPISKMVTFESIDELNTYLSDNLTKLDIKEYIQKYHDILHADIDVSFMDYFLYLCEHPNEIIVKHEKLIEFGIFDSTRSSVIKERITSIELVESVDYLLQNVLQQLPSGTKHSNHYTLTPKAFKLCLMRSKKQIKYAKYYLFLEECIHYYQKYQELYTNVLLSGKDTKIDEQSKKIDELLKENKEQSKKMDEQSKKMDEQSKKMDEQSIRINKLLDGTDFIKSQNEDLKKEVHKVNVKLDKMEHYLKNVFQVIDNNSISMFQTNCLVLYKITYKDTSIKYFLSSRQLIDIIKTCKEKRKQPNIQSITNLRVFEPTNDASIVKLIKNRLKKHKNITINYNTIDASCIQEELLIQTIESILNETKYNVFEKMGVEYNQNHIDAYSFIYKKIVERAFDRYFRLNEDINHRVMKEIYSSLKQELPKEEE